MTEISKETIQAIIERIDENVKEVKDQTIRTNNRVTKLEIWKAKIIGAIIIMNVIFIPLVIILFKNLIN